MLKSPPIFKLISPRTVEFYVFKIYEKLKIRNRCE
ncbi:MAG: hypothetical protein GX081_10350 [Firmicutes bacterium]|nr:hypothetical protein [Bacillota bacterium]